MPDTQPGSRRRRAMPGRSPTIADLLTASTIHREYTLRVYRSRLGTHVQRTPGRVTKLRPSPTAIMGNQYAVSCGGPGREGNMVSASRAGPGRLGHDRARPAERDLRALACHDAGGAAPVCRGGPV